MVQEGIITVDQLTVARVSHQNLGEDLGRILIRKGFVTEQQLLVFLGKSLSIPYVSLKKYPVNVELVKKLPAHIARRHHLLPIRSDGPEIVVAMSDPLDLFALEEVRQATQAAVRPVLASSDEIEELIDRYY